MSVLLSALLITGCKKEDTKDYNVITVEGNSIEGIDGTYIPESCDHMGPTVTGCEPAIYYNIFLITFEGGATMSVTVYTTDEISGIPTGTFEVAGECEEGFSGYFWHNLDAKSPGPIFESGTLSVSKKDNVYDIDLDAVIDPNGGGGTIKGNFKGTITEAVIR